jgi:hypothetical protein
MKKLSALFSCLLAGSVLAAEEPVTAAVRYSDGSIVSGQLSIIGSRPLTLVPLGERRQRFFALKDLLAIDQDIENADMAKPWTFKESGKPDKVFLEGEYPLMNFLTRVSLVTGQVVTGHVISAAFTLKTDDAKSKVFLQRQIKGEKTQKLADVVYVSTIRFPAAVAADGKPIRGQVSGYGTVQEVTAFDAAREQVVFAKVGKDGSFDFGSLLPGAYDLCVLTDTHVLLGFSGAPLTNDLAAVQKVFPLADDFFKDRWVLGLAGTHAYAKALVYKRRDKYYESERWTPGGFLWHVEFWSWHLAGDEWKVDKRFILIRHKQQGGEKNRQLLLCPALGAVTPGATIPALNPVTPVRSLD